MLCYYYKSYLENEDNEGGEVSAPDERAVESHEDSSKVDGGNQEVLLLEKHFDVGEGAVEEGEGELDEEGAKREEEVELGRGDQHKGQEGEGEQQEHATNYETGDEGIVIGASINCCRNLIRHFVCFREEALLHS